MEGRASCTRTLRADSGLRVCFFGDCRAAAAHCARVVGGDWVFARKTMVTALGPKQKSRKEPMSAAAGPSPPGVPRRWSAGRDDCIVRGRGTHRAVAPCAGPSIRFAARALRQVFPRAIVNKASTSAPPQQHAAAAACMGGRSFAVWVLVAGDGVSGWGREEKGYGQLTRDS